MLVGTASFATRAGAQRLDVAGTVVCQDPVRGATLASDVLVVYADDPSIGSRTTRGHGTFRLIFPRPRKIRARNITLEFWPNQQKEEHTWFVPPSPTNVLDGIPAFVVPEDVMLDARCDQIDPKAATKAEAQENMQAAGFASHVLQLLALIPAAAGAAADEEVLSISKERLPIIASEPGNETGPLDLARTTDFPFLGFRYAPRTYAGSAIATNPAAVALGDGLEIQTNGAVRGIQPYRFSVVADWADGRNFGIGFAYFVQVNSKERAIQYGQGESLVADTQSHAHTFVLAPAYQLSPGLAVSLAPTLTLQYLEDPKDIARTTTVYGRPEGGTTVPTRTVVEDEVNTVWRNRGRVDAAASIVYDVTTNIRLGAGIQNILGTTERVRGRKLSERTVGAGFSTAYYRLQVGADVEYSQAHGFDGTAGASFFVSNGFEFGAGYLTKGGLYRLWSRVGPVVVGVARNQDDAWFVNLGSRVVY
ncbi:MAG TPA: hypothetical protein VFQ35_20070 [Polyangiaceae bacterium]|nr:hypothetical protein [Polyangiaceae bacterium]